MKINISVIITTKNAGDQLAACLATLGDFDQIIIVDSHSGDSTAELSARFHTEFVLYHWNGKYPKKRQWCLDTLPLKHDWVFFVDADEIVTPALTEEIRRKFQSPPTEAGFFISGNYIWNGKPLSYGLKNNKLALFNHHKIHFPVIDDLNCPGMGEIEGHYQPVLKDKGYIGALKTSLLHDANHSHDQWRARHQRYAAWEICMTRKKAWPKDPIPWRNFAKYLLRHNPLKAELAFLHCYVLKLGFLDGAAGYDFAKSRWIYYHMIRSGMDND